jgi:hypothetical protein
LREVIDEVLSSGVAARCLSQKPFAYFHLEGGWRSLDLPGRTAPSTVETDVR